MWEHTLKGVILVHIAFILGVISPSEGYIYSYRYTVYTGYRLTGYLFRTIYTRDWLHCLSTCYNNRACGSYNFNQQDGVCELNREIRDELVTEGKLIRELGMFFQQIKGKPVLLTKTDESQKVESDACNCCAMWSCNTISPTATISSSIGSTAENPAMSCKSIYNANKNAGNGAYYIKAINEDQFTHVYCHMDPITECGSDGGWTLAMKINGNKDTFSYPSDRWTNNVSYNETNGLDLLEHENKMPTFWSTPFEEICLGMKIEKIKRWLIVQQLGLSLHALLGGNNFTPINASVDQWKGLVGNGSLQTSSTKSGFNVQIETSSASAKARIGIIGFPTSTQLSSSSRIGFGTAGSIFGMDPGNSCGNDAKNNPDNGDTAIKAFGYILVR